MKTIPSERLSVSIAKPLADFIESYKARYKLKTKSEVVERALQELQNIDMSYQYERAMEEYINSEEVELLDSVSGDGILPETNLL
ncbi:MAG: hypothetical protein AAF267_06900 [Deinococcota bacterium]